MANHKSPKKYHRKSTAIAARNRSAKSRINTLTKSLLSAVEGSDLKLATEAFNKAQAVIMQSAKKGILEFNTASRRVSNLAKSLKSIDASYTATKTSKVTKEKVESDSAAAN